ncbi:MAG TPA: hypothetical protein VFK86_12705 [Bauldia sp.]|nr:hypothetical protein [Bauldia sp.]
MSLQNLRLARVCLLAAAANTIATAAFAALPPFWQSAREISMIVNDPRVHDALKYEEPILSITTTGDDVYELKTSRCTLQITIVDTPQAEPMPGPRQFDLEVGEADCE